MTPHSVLLDLPFTQYLLSLTNSAMCSPAQPIQFVPQPQEGQLYTSGDRLTEHQVPGLRGFHRDQTSQKISGEMDRFSKGQRNVRPVEREMREILKCLAARTKENHSRAEKVRLDVRWRGALVSAEGNHSRGLNDRRGTLAGNLRRFRS